MDPLTAQMAGPTIRAWHMALALAAEHEVVLATTGPCTLDGTGFRTCTVDAAGLSRLAQWCEVVVVRGFVLQRHPVLGHREDGRGRRLRPHPPGAARAGT
ncbi:MAG: hypothetical protein M3P97_05600 [Actinomycetota bacterium]|nr:hypothetical protein [Actinomycetota bacterium]